MAKPDLKNGYLKIATELAEAFCRLKASGREWKIIWVVIRKTYGWHKKRDKISLSQMAKMTKINRVECCKIVNRLIHKNIIKRYVVKTDNSKTAIYGLEKDYSKWRVLSKRTTGK